MVIENRGNYERIMTDEEEAPKEKLTPFLYSLVFSVCLGGFLFGYDTGVISGALSPLEKDFDMGIRQKEYIVGGTTLGAIFGGFFAGSLSDRFGRKPLVLCASAIFIIGSAMLSLANSYSILLSGRLVVGLGVGIASMIIPVYISEIAPKNFRGRLSTLNTFAITFGQVVAYIVNLIFANTKGGWRYMFGFGALPAIIQLIIMPFMPESPRRMVVAGKIGKARDTLQKIYGSSASDEFILKEIEAIEHNMQYTLTGTYRDFLKPVNLKPLLIACMLQAAQQLSGFNTVMYYAATILKMANFQDPTAVALVVAVANMIFTIIAVYIIDKAGRRPVLIITMLSMIMSLFILGGSFALQQPSNKENCLSSKNSTNNCDGAQSFWVSTLLLVSLTSYVASYALGLGYIPWIIQGELFTLQLRGKANGIATATNWVCNLIAASTFLTMTTLLSAAGTFWFYAFISSFLWIFIAKYVPETANKTLEEISSLFYE